MGIENIIKKEMLNVNRGIIKKRKSIRKLLEEPWIEVGKEKIKIDEECINRIAEKTTLPLDSLLLPVSFFVPAGLDEGYVEDERDARILEIFDVIPVYRKNKYWVKKYIIRKLEISHPGCFQSILVK